MLPNRRRSWLDELIDDVPVVAGVMFLALLVATVVVMAVRAV